MHFPHPPWVRVSNLVSRQAIVLDLPVKACKTKDNVTVNIDITLAFRIMGDAASGEDPDLVRKFVHELKPRRLEHQLRDAQDEAVRALARILMHTQIYGIWSGENLKHIQQNVAGAIFNGTPLEEEEKAEEGNETGLVVSSAATETSGRLGIGPIPMHRDETLVGRSDQEDREAAKVARTAGEDVTEYMKQRLNRQFK